MEDAALIEQYLAERHQRATQGYTAHAVFATNHQHEVYRVSDPLAWGHAQNVWEKLDTLRREGRLPQTKHFEVREVQVGPDRPIVGPEIRSHGKYDGAKLDLIYTKPVVGKGYADSTALGSYPYTGQMKAARAAWKLRHPEFKVTSYDGRVVPCEDQGRGGWYYWPNGRPAAQGLRDLGRICERRGYIVEGADRWYVLEIETL